MKTVTKAINFASNQGYMHLIKIFHGLITFLKAVMIEVTAEDIWHNAMKRECSKEIKAMKKTDRHVVITLLHFIKHGSRFLRDSNKDSTELFWEFYKSVHSSIDTFSYCSTPADT